MFILISVVLMVSLLPSGIFPQSPRAALGFGKTTSDYIQLPDDIMDNSTSQFSLCTWIRKRHNAEQGVVLHSYRHGVGSGDEEIVLGDNGYFNYVAGTNLDLRSEYNVSEGTWFHVCLCWSTSDYTSRVYLDGNMVQSRVKTSRRQLRTGSKMALGNWASNAQNARYTFGGDLFKLNIYNRVLTQSEIKNMSQDICSVEEEKLSALKVLSWEEIIEQRRSGSVNEILMDCDCEDTSEMRETLLESEAELERTKRELSVLKENVTACLEIAREDLASLKKNISQLFEIAWEDLVLAKKNISQLFETAREDRKQSGKSGLGKFSSSKMDKFI